MMRRIANQISKKKASLGTSTPSGRQVALYLEALLNEWNVQINNPIITNTMSACIVESF